MKHIKKLFCARFRMVLLPGLLLTGLLITGLLLVGQGPALAQTNNNALKGIEAMGVVVNPIDPDLVRTDFSVTYLQTQLEVELRKAGIKVTDHTSLAETTGRPYLELSVNAVKVALNMYSYHIELKLMQHVQLRREPNMILSTITWTRTQLGNQNRNKVADLNKDIQFMTNQFINDYFTVNPK